MEQYTFVIAFSRGRSRRRRRNAVLRVAGCAVNGHVAIFIHPQAGPPVLFTVAVKQASTIQLRFPGFRIFYLSRIFVEARLLDTALSQAINHNKITMTVTLKLLHSMVFILNRQSLRVAINDDRHTLLLFLYHINFQSRAVLLMNTHLTIAELVVTYALQSFLYNIHTLCKVSMPNNKIANNQLKYSVPWLDLADWHPFKDSHRGITDCNPLLLPVSHLQRKIIQVLSI